MAYAIEYYTIISIYIAAVSTLINMSYHVKIKKSRIAGAIFSFLPPFTAK